MTIILLASFIQLIVNGAGYDAWISELGETKVKPWPWWAIIMIIFLIGISVLWIPIVALLRYECRNDFILFFVISFSYLLNKTTKNSLMMICLYTTYRCFNIWLKTIKSHFKICKNATQNKFCYIKRWYYFQLLFFIFRQIIKKCIHSGKKLWLVH